jgi:1-acyl-sn-glycerol-3-phosphate acyltransferase
VAKPVHAATNRRDDQPRAYWLSWRSIPTFLIGVVATVRVAVFLRFGRSRSDPAAIDAMVRWWASVWLRAAGASVHVHGSELVAPSTDYVVVSNHQSNLDSVLHLYVLPMSLRFLAKHEVFQIPLLGRLMRMVGMLEVDRAAPDVRRIDDAARRCLAAGHSLLVYPEGTTSGNGEIAPFKIGAFVIAATNKVPVLPVAIEGTRSIWAPGRCAIRRGEIHVVIGAPLWTDDTSHQGVAQLRDHARDVITSTHCDLLAMVAPGTAPTDRT